MKRRDFVKNLATGAGATAVASTGLAHAAKSEVTDDPNSFDTIVIGGGFAGVTAARDVSQAGHKTLLLDARARLGGRTFTTTFADHHTDVGGTWLGWGQPSVWAEKMRYDLPIDESAATKAGLFVWYEDGKRKTGGAEDFWPVVYEAYDKFYAPAFELLPRPHDPLYMGDKLKKLDNISAGDAIESLDLTRYQKDALHSFASINGHSHSKNSSYLDQLRWLALSGFNKDFMWANIGAFRLKHGTKELIDHMQADSKAQLKKGSAVVKVEQKGDSVIVTTNRKEQFRARSVIMAVPLNVLPDIEFKPGLSAIKQSASKQGHTGSGVKVYMRIKGRLPVTFCNGTQDMPFNYVWTEYDEDDQILVGFGRSPELLDVNDDEEVEKALRQYLPEAQLLESYSYDWNLDPYSKSTWCMYPPGMLTGALAELQRPEGNVYFAGSDIANGWRGFIDGAIESGARAAQMVTEKDRS